MFKSRSRVRENRLDHVSYNIKRGYSTANPLKEYANDGSVRPMTLCFWQLPL